MTYSEWQKAGGVGAGSGPVSSYCIDLRINEAIFRETPIADLIGSKHTYFQRFFAGSILVQPNHVPKIVRDLVFDLVLAEYEKHLGCEHRIEKWGISCLHGAYYDPRKTVTEIYGERVALTWGVR